MQLSSNCANRYMPQSTLLKHRLRRTISGWNDWWLPEVAAGNLSIICLVVIIAILAHFDGKPLIKWSSKITPNAVISILATVSKASVLLPVAECISQFTWIRFQTPLYSLHNNLTRQAVVLWVHSRSCCLPKPWRVVWRNHHFDCACVRAFRTASLATGIPRDSSQYNKQFCTSINHLQHWQTRKCIIPNKLLSDRQSCPLT
jgi:hypothetical protein